MRTGTFARSLRSLRSGGSGPWALLSAIVLALMIAPLAVGAGEGDPVTGGERNPNANQTERLEQETEIIAETGRDTYGTRQSNTGEGGGAIYGCRSTITSANVLDPKANTPCVRVNNLNDGLAFQLRSGGALGGTIEVGDGGDGVRPFVTNATGVANGLNADRVDNLNADQIVALARQGMTGAGPDGEQGEDGAAGPAGPAGPVGPAGADGVVAPQAAITPASAPEAGFGGLPVVNLEAEPLTSTRPDADDQEIVSLDLEAGRYILEGTIQFFDFGDTDGGPDGATEYGVGRVFIDDRPGGTLWSPDVPDDGNNAAQATASTIIELEEAGEVVVRGVMRTEETDGGQAGANLIATPVAPAPAAG